MPVYNSRLYDLITDVGPHSLVLGDPYSIPGLAFFLGGSVTQNSFQTYDTGPGGATTNGVLNLGVSNLVNAHLHSSNIGTQGTLFSANQFDDGYTGENANAYGAHQAPGELTQIFDQYLPACYDAVWTPNPTPPQSRPVAGLLLGNQCFTKIGSFVLNSTTGNQSVTGVGFQPDLVIFFAPFDRNTGTAEMEGSGFGLGCMDSSGNQWAGSIRSVLGSGKTSIGGLLNQITRYSEWWNNACLSHIGAVQFDTCAQTVDQRAHYISMDANGFTVDLTAAGTDACGTAMTVFYVAIKAFAGGSLKCGLATQGDASISVGFTPDSMLFYGTQQTANGVVSSVANEFCGLQDNTSWEAQWHGALTGLVNSLTPPGNPSMYFGNDGSILMSHITSGTPDTYAVIAKAHATLSSSTPALTWAVDNGAGYKFGWIAFKINEVVDTTPPIVVTDAPTAITTTGGTMNGTITPNSTVDLIDFSFDYGLSPSYGSNTGVITSAMGTTPIPFDYVLTGYSVGDVIYYRAKAIDETTGCTTFGAQQVIVIGSSVLLDFRNRWRAETHP